MSEIHKFMFQGMPVRGVLVKVDAAWSEVLQRRLASGVYPEPVRRLLGEMTAAALLLQASIQFNGALVLQFQGDGPLKLAVVEVQADFSFRATAKVSGEVAKSDHLQSLLNPHGGGRCAITLDPKNHQPGQQTYQGVVALNHADGTPLTTVAEVVQQYMQQSAQLDSCLVLAESLDGVAGLLIQHLPLEGGHVVANAEVEAAEHGARIMILAQSLRRDELLSCSADEILHRLFWQEPLRHLAVLQAEQGPRFACACSRQRVAGMLQGLGVAEVQDLVREQGQVNIACEFCGQQYRFDAVDAQDLFTAPIDHPPSSSALQ